MANGKSKTPYVIGIVFVILFIIVGVILIFVGLSTNNPPGTVCTSDTNCSPTQTCTGGYCVEINCNLNSDCRAAQECAFHFCYQSYCDTVSDCYVGGVTDGVACVNNLCVPFGLTCNNSNDCYNGTFKCSDGKCVQCVTNSDCPNGNICDGGLCISGCTADTNCPSGNLCYSGVCCPTGGNVGISCTSVSCGAGLYCVNGVCLCRAGQIGDTCTSNTDCASNHCLGGICAQSGATCLYNAGESSPYSCPSSTPYCVNGKCTTSTIGAPCTCTSPTDSGCNSYNSCMVPPPSGSTLPGQVAYCVNNVCSRYPGWVGAKCNSSTDCSIINGPPNCQNGRCV